MATTLSVVVTATAMAQTQPAAMLGEMKPAAEQQATQEKQKASDEVQSQVNQTMQKTSDKSDAAMGKVDSKLDNLLGK
jgi:F0F1-type ATP synthase membrane subunit b/b'